MLGAGPDRLWWVRDHRSPARHPVTLSPCHPPPPTHTHTSPPPRRTTTTAAPFVMLGALVAYLKQHSDCNYYVQLYCAYYLPGLFVSLLQQRYDARVDEWIGSGRAYAYRGGLLFGLTLATVSAMRHYLLDAGVMITLTLLLGVFTWALHGSVSMLAQMGGGRAIVAQQIGFQLPALISLVLVTSMGLDAHATEKSITIYFEWMIACVAVGTAAGVVLLRSDSLQAIMGEKDMHRAIFKPGEFRGTAASTTTIDAAGLLDEVDETGKSGGGGGGGNRGGSTGGRGSMDAKSAPVSSELDEAGKKRVMSAIWPLTW